MTEPMLRQPLRQASLPLISLLLATTLAVLLTPLRELLVPEFPAIHTLMETACIAISLMAFAVHFVLRRFGDKGYYQAIAIPFLGVGIMDLFHLLSFPGMPELVSPSSVQKGIVFWLGARLLETLALLFFTLSMGKRWTRSLPASVIYLIVFTYCAVLIFLGLWKTEIFPAFMGSGEQLAPAKVGMEAFFILCHLGIALILFKTALRHGAPLRHLINASLIFALSGLCFATYHHPTGLVIFLGHALKILAYLQIFQAILVSELLLPYAHLIKLNQEVQGQSRRLKKLQNRLFQAERMSALGLSVASVVHDINNLLTITMHSARKIHQLTRSSAVDASIGKQAEVILRSIAKTKGMQEQLLHKAGLSSEEPEYESMCSALEDLLPLLEAIAGPKVKLSHQCCNEKDFRFNRVELEQILLNLVANAKDAIGSNNGSISLAATKRQFAQPLPTAAGLLEPGDYLELQVEDSGKGFDPGTLPEAFDSYFTTKASSGHSGLGLSTIYDILVAHRGGIQIESTPGLGSSIRLFLPMS